MCTTKAFPGVQVASGQAAGLSEVEGSPCRDLGGCQPVKGTVPFCSQGIVQVTWETSAFWGHFHLSLTDSSVDTLASASLAAGSWAALSAAAPRAAEGAGRDRARERELAPSWTSARCCAESAGMRCWKCQGQGSPSCQCAGPGDGPLGRSMGARPRQRQHSTGTG